MTLAGRGETILLVEDEPALRELAALVLTSAGFHVLSAADAESAVRVLDEHHGVALLFTDIVMPGACDGVALAIRARRRRPDLPVLFATGYADRGVFAAWPGAAKLLAKPYSPEALVSKVGACLDEARHDATANQS